MAAMRRTILLFALLAGVTAGCSAHRPLVLGNPAPASPPEPELGWHAVVMPADRQALDGLAEQFLRARRSVPARYGKRMATEGPIVQPNAAQPMPALPPGPYHCRLLRFGGRVGFRTYDPDICYLQPGADAMSFTKDTGSTLLTGWVYPDTDVRLVFLGTVRTSQRTKTQAYGDPDADNLAGIVERVSPFRWRLILTRGRQGSALDILELVPVTPDVPGARPAVPDPHSTD